MLGEIKVKTGSRVEMVDITPFVRSEVLQSGVTSGICFVYVPHTTAGVTINEGADPDVCTDIVTQLNKLVPPDIECRHIEGNSDSIDPPYRQCRYRYALCDYPRKAQKLLAKIQTNSKRT
jgi:secondary thiamine-phosphate synthase enzyme